MSDLVRWVGRVIIVAGVTAVGWAILQPYVDAAVLMCGSALIVAGIAIVLSKNAMDVLADHPVEMEDARRRAADARARRLAADERRRLGLAGWQKPVAPPSDEDRPGGLPPRR